MVRLTARAPTPSHPHRPLRLSPRRPPQMRLDLPLKSPVARAAAAAALIGTCGWLLYLVLGDFLIGALIDERIRMTADADLASFITAPFRDDRVGVNPAIVAVAPRLHMRLFKAETYKPQIDDWRLAEFHALRATHLSPHDYRPRLQLASIQQYKADLAAAEESAHAAVELAPNDPEAHYQLGTILWSRGNAAYSFKEFRAAISSDAAYLATVLYPLWGDTNENADALQASIPDKPKERLALARFLLEQSRPMESAAVFRQIDPVAVLRDPQSAQYLDSLIAAGHVTLAYELWLSLVQHGEAPEERSNAIWNGGFESDVLVDFSQFDWSIQPSKYARVSIDTSIAHTGRRSLRIDFLGHETTRLEDEIKQVLLLHQGTRYRLRYHVRTEDLIAPEGPRIVVSNRTSNQWLAASDPAPQGSHDWQQETLEFTASDSPLVIAIKQRPRFSYEPSSHGTIWFDDFEIREIP